MPFSPLCEISLTESWQVTPVSTANYFRLRYDANLGFSNVVLAQAQVSQDGLELFGTFRFSLKGQSSDVTDLEIPKVFIPEQRRLAVRGLGPRNQPGKTLTLIIEEATMILNPSGTATTKEAFKELQQADALSRELCPANANRNGGMIFNQGSKTLWVGFGAAAEKSSPNKILPGGLMDIPNGFTGPIFIIFDAADTNLTKKAVAQELVS
jgi:hypothetical protein